MKKSLVFQRVLSIQHSFWIKNNRPGAGTPKRFEDTIEGKPTMTPEQCYCITCPSESLPIFKKGQVIILRNLTGQKFGRLTAICPVAKNNRGAVLWLCECDCGLDSIVESGSLTRGSTRSCGCLDREAHQFRPNRTTHGQCGTRLYRIWKKMKSRCTNPNDPDYKKYYGSRGITVCPEWKNDFQAFHAWAMSHGYSDELTIDRIDNDKGYSPDNCRWATAEEQRHNQRREGGDES